GDPRLSRTPACRRCAPREWACFRSRAGCRPGGASPFNPANDSGRKLMGLSDIDKVAALLPTYPYAVRAVMFGGLVVWTLAYALLVFFAPPPEPARITMARFAALVDAPRLA